MMTKPRWVSSTNPSSQAGPWIYSFVFALGVLFGNLHANLSNSASDTTETTSNNIRVLEKASQQPPSSLRDNNNNNNGWHSIDVFYGDSNHLERQLAPEKRWFSQCRQDEIVGALLKFKRNGYFLDLAANDATTLSNTYALEKQLGWSGLCIEANPIYWANLTYRDCQVVGAVVGKERMEEVHFRFDAGDKSGIVGFDNGIKFRQSSTPRYTVPLREVLERYQAPKMIDYLSLDVEGAEEFIMDAFPLEDYTISVLTVERPSERLQARLEKGGYKFAMRLSRWGEKLFVHSSMEASLDMNVLEELDPRKRRAQGIKDC